MTIETLERRIRAAATDVPLLTADHRCVGLFDSEGKKHAVQRDEVEQLVASSKSLMPEGFEKQVSPDDIVNLLEFLTAREQS